MIVWGTKDKLFKGDKIYMMGCRNCGQQKHAGYVTAKYFHLFWIPTILWVKDVGAICTNCDACTEGDALDSAIRKDIRSDVLPPMKRLAYFAGLFLLALLIGWATYAHSTQNKLMQGYLAHPKVNDIYVIDVSEFVDLDRSDTVRYGALRVTAIQNDKEIFAQLSNFRSNKVLRIMQEVNEKKVKTDEDAFSHIAIAIPLTSLRQMLDNGTIQDIVRN